MRAPWVSTSASWGPVASAKWPRWLGANCSSHPCGVSARGDLITPALLIRMCGGPSHSATNLSWELRSVRSSAATCTPSLSGEAVMSATNVAASLKPAHREGHVGAGRRENAGRLDADTRGRGGHDRAFAAEVDAGDDLVGGGLKSEWVVIKVDSLEALERDRREQRSTAAVHEVGGAVTLAHPAAQS